MSEINEYTLKTDEASGRLGVSQNTFRKLVERHQIKHIKIGREKRYRPEDLDKLTKAGSVIEVEEKVYAVHNPKGGTGKTTSTGYIAYILAKMGKKVLVVDADPQYYFTRFWSSFLTDIEKSRIADFNLLTFLQGKKHTKVIYNISKNLDFIPGSRKLEKYDSLFAGGFLAELKLKKTLSVVLPYYDIILIDTCAAQTGVTIAALFASNKMITPVDPEADSLEAAHDLAELIGDIKREDPENFTLNEIDILPIKQTKGFIKRSFQEIVLKEIHEGFKNHDYGINVFVLEPIMEYPHIKEERWEGLFKEETDVYKNYRNVIQGMMQ